MTCMALLFQEEVQPEGCGSARQEDGRAGAWAAGQQGARDQGAQRSNAQGPPPSAQRQPHLRPLQVTTLATLIHRLPALQSW